MTRLIFDGVKRNMEGFAYMYFVSLFCIIVMPPTLKKLMGHIAFGACVGVSHFLYLFVL